MCSGPSGTPRFIPSKISQLSTSLDVYWEPPPVSSINGEFLGYILSYRPGQAVLRTKLEIRDESFKTQVYLFLHVLNIILPIFQNYSLTGLSRHTDYIVTVAARNLEGLGPEAIIELRTEDGG